MQRASNKREQQTRTTNENDDDEDAVREIFFFFLRTKVFKRCRVLKVFRVLLLVPFVTLSCQQHPIPLEMTTVYVNS